MRILQSPRAQVVAGTSLTLLRFLFTFLSIGSCVSWPAVSAAMNVAAVAISRAISTAASLLLSAASSVSRQLLSLTLTWVITSVKPASCRLVLVIGCLLADASCQSHFQPSLYANPLSCVDSSEHPPPPFQGVLGMLFRGQFYVMNRLLLSVFRLLLLLLTYFAVSFWLDFCCVALVRCRCARGCSRNCDRRCA